MKWLKRKIKKIKQLGRRTAIAYRTLKRNKIIQAHMQRDDWYDIPALWAEVAKTLDDMGREFFPGVLRQMIRGSKMMGGVCRGMAGVFKFLEGKKPPGPAPYKPKRIPEK